MNDSDFEIGSSFGNSTPNNTSSNGIRQKNQTVDPNTNGTTGNPNNDLAARKAKFAKGFKIAAIIAGTGTATTGILSIVGATLAAFTAIAFLPYTAILALGISAAGLAITTIGFAIASRKNKKADEQELVKTNSQNSNQRISSETITEASDIVTQPLNKGDKTAPFQLAGKIIYRKNLRTVKDSKTKREVEIKDLDNVNPANIRDLLEDGQKLVPDTIYFSNKRGPLGRGESGFVNTVIAEFVNKTDKNAKSQVKAVEKVYNSDTDVAVIANEVMINYVLTRYITKNYETIKKDKILKECVNNFPLLILTPEQDKVLSQAKSYEELLRKLSENIHHFKKIYFEQKLGVNMNNHLSKAENIEYSTINTCFKQTLMELVFLNYLGIAHHDIKPGNIIINAADNANIASIFGFEKSYLSLSAAKRFYTENKNVLALNEAYCASPEAYKKNRPKPIRENAFGIGTLLLQMCLPNDGISITKETRTAVKREYAIIENEVRSRFTEIQNDEYFKRKDLKQFSRFFAKKEKFLIIDRKFAKKGLAAAKKLKEQLECVSSDSGAQALLEKINNFEAKINEKKNFLMAKQNSDINIANINMLASCFDKTRRECWQRIYNNLEEIVKNPEKIFKRNHIRKNYTKQDQETIIEILRGFLNPDPQKRITCEKGLKKYFNITLNFSDLPKLKDLDIFSEGAIG